VPAGADFLQERDGGERHDERMKKRQRKRGKKRSSLLTPETYRAAIPFQF